MSDNVIHEYRVSDADSLEAEALAVVLAKAGGVVEYTIDDKPLDKKVVVTDLTPDDFGPTARYRIELVG